MDILDKILKSIQSTLGTFTPVDPTRIFGIDTSHWSGVIDWKKAKANGVRFAIIKASDGIFESKYFRENWWGAKAEGIPVGAYTWMYASNTTPSGSTTRQAQVFWELMKDMGSDLPLTCDFEWGKTYNPTQKDLYAFVATLDSLSGRKTQIYSAPSYWAQYGVPVSGFYAQHPFWQAQYKVATPSLVQPFKTVLWQFTDRIDGIYYGSSGEKMLDGNYFMGTESEFAQYTGKDAPVEPPIPTPEPVIETGTVTVSSLNIRTSAGTNYPVYGSLTFGDKVDIYEIRDTILEVWGRIKSGWACLFKDGTYFTTIRTFEVTNPPPVEPTSEPNLVYMKPRYVPSGPAIIAGSDAPRQNHPNFPLDGMWQQYIKQLNNNDADVIRLWVASDVGPSKGMNNMGKLLYIPASWSFNVVRKLGVEGEWTKIEAFDMRKGVPSLINYTHTSTPHLINIMTTVNKNNQFVTFPDRPSGQPSAWNILLDPILSNTGYLYIPNEWILELCTVVMNSVNVRSGAGTDFPVTGGMVKGNKTKIYELKRDEYDNIWGRISLNSWIALRYKGFYYTDWEVR